MNCWTHMHKTPPLHLWPSEPFASESVQYGRHPHSKKHRIPPNRHIHLHRSSSWQLLTVTQKLALEQNFRVQASRYFVCMFHQVDKITWIKMWFLECCGDIITPNQFSKPYQHIKGFTVCSARFYLIHSVSKETHRGELGFFCGRV